MSTTAPTLSPIDLDALERAIAGSPAPEGVPFEQVTEAYANATARDFTSHQLTTALRELEASGRIARTKGPRGENVYLPASPEEDPLERLQREKRQLQQALGALTAAATFATARLDQHQRREDHWRELLEANDEAKQALEATQ
jgi:hypothetical protein